MAFGLGAPLFTARAADHADSPTASEDAPADIADCFFFRDPNDPAGTTPDKANLILGMTTHGFIVPSEAKNLAFFDPGVLYRFEIENTGDAKPDLFVDIRFSKRTDPAVQQDASITIHGNGFKTIKLSAKTTVPTLGTDPNPLLVSTDDTTKIKFAAGEADDPFFFDIPAFNQFVAAAVAHQPHPESAFTRARDSFAGYNVMAIALSIPGALLQGKGAATNIGLSVATLRQSRLISNKGEIIGAGSFRQIDRMGNPAVNVALIPFADKNAYNASTTVEDARKTNPFTAKIVATLTALSASQDAINTLATVAVAHGDMLHLDLTKPQNSGPKGGTNADGSYPNGRRLADDTIDIILGIIAGGTLGDGVDASDVAPTDSFPFFAPPHQPLPNGGVDTTEN